MTTAGKLRKKVRWVVLNFKTASAVCERCGETERIPLPLAIEVFGYWATYFMAKHEDCAPKEAQA